MVREFRGCPRPPVGRVAVVVAEVNRFITRRLLDGALEELQECGVPTDQIDVIWVPGSFEVPAALEAAIASGRYGALVALGCVLRGETDHYYFIGREVADGVAHLARRHRIGIGFGILTCLTVEQALERTGPEHHLGREAVRAALTMADLLAQLEGNREPSDVPHASTRR